MLLERERLTRLRVGQSLLDTLERMGCGGVLLDTAGEAVEANSAAIRLLDEEIGDGSDLGDLQSIRSALKKLLRRANTRFTMAADTWVTIPRHAKRDLVFHAVCIENGGADCHTALIMVDLSAPLEPQPDVLQKLFGLTDAEARLAIQITRGDTPADIARITGVSIATIRSQLAAVFSKTQTGRQAELVALLARVAILP